MTLWINGDWITGQGASRVKRNPVSGEVLWQGNDADAAQVEQACRAAVRRFRAGRGFHLLNVMPLSNALPHCWKAIKPN
ncbi:hypothetical protein ECZU45_03570 [Escherichia coli]|nr:hypothetical protein ECZU45_03570 [Escherichia coli]